MSTQSPCRGRSSCKSPRSTLRRTPKTSTMARSRSSSSNATIFPGIAKHISLILLSRDDIESKLQLVLQFQAAPHHAHRLDAEIGLRERNFTGGAKFSAQDRQLRRHHERTRHPVERKIAVHV